MLHASDAIAAREQIESAILRLKWLAAAARFQLALRRHDHALKANFNPGQPRVPAGQTGGGQWAGEGGGGGSGEERTFISDEVPDSVATGQRYAQSAPRGPYIGRGPILINGQWVQPTPAQSALLASLEARADTAVRRVQEVFLNGGRRPVYMGRLRGEFLQRAPAPNKPKLVFLNFSATGSCQDCSRVNPYRHVGPSEIFML